MKLTEEWFRKKDTYTHYLNLIPDMLNDIIEEASIRWCCNYEEFQEGFPFIMKQILENQEKAEKWNKIQVEHWGYDYTNKLEQENKHMTLKEV